MYSAQFKALRSELSNVTNESLAVHASSGGWRKYLIDRGRESPRSWMDLSQVFMCLTAAGINLLPPLGKKYRRALVAQAIMDKKATVW